MSLDERNEQTDADGAQCERVREREQENDRDTDRDSDSAYR